MENNKELLFTELNTYDDVLHIRNSTREIYKMTNSLHFHLSNKTKKAGEKSSSPAS
jgi:hypothetical protein